MKRLAIFLDGTWNDEGSRTNVYELFLKAHEGSAPDGVVQKKHWDPGVGTKWYNKLSGGTLGRGLSANVRAAYRWILEEYEDGDQVYIFGFSRGAYTARSLGGLIANCGLARRGAPFDIDYLYDRYQRRKADAAPIYQLEHIRTQKLSELTAEETQLLEHSRRIDIEMIGVWDTVGALGVPWTGMPLIGKDSFYFHNPNLSSIYRNAFHAMALDENRGAYHPTLWTLFKGDMADGKTPPAPLMPVIEKVEQRWFVGAHANVGGGYKGSRLAIPPLAWMQRKAQGLGLHFSETVAPGATDHQEAPKDSYANFLWHGYQLVTLGHRYWRPIGLPFKKVNKGWSFPVNETIDASVFKRYQYTDQYRPKNLLDWATRKQIDLATVSGDQPA